MTDEPLRLGHHHARSLGYAGTLAQWLASPADREPYAMRTAGRTIYAYRSCPAAPGLGLVVAEGARYHDETYALLLGMPRVLRTDEECRQYVASLTDDDFRTAAEAYAVALGENGRVGKANWGPSRWNSH